MAKLTKGQRNSLEQVLRHLERAMRYIEHPDTVVACAGKAPATTSLHFVRGDETLYPVNKEYGSNLTGLSMGISDLKRFIERSMI